MSIALFLQDLPKNIQKFSLPTWDISYATDCLRVGFSLSTVKKKKKPLTSLEYWTTDTKHESSHCTFAHMPSERFSGCISCLIMYYKELEIDQ